MLLLHSSTVQFVLWLKAAYANVVVRRPAPRLAQIPTQIENPIDATTALRMTQHLRCQLRMIRYKNVIFGIVPFCEAC